MKYRLILSSLIICIAVILVMSSCSSTDGKAGAVSAPDESVTIIMPEPRFDSDVSLEESLLARRSTRNYSSEPLKLDEISQLLWAAQGITDDAGHRTAPSAIALYPMTIYVVVGNVPEILPGIYTYDPKTQSITRTADGDFRNDLTDASMGQVSVRQGAASFVFTADYDIVMSRLGKKGEMFAQLEAGHAAQNLCLQAAALELGVVTMGAIDNDKVAEVLSLPDNLTPLYVIPAGRMEKSPAEQQ